MTPVQTVEQLKVTFGDAIGEPVEFRGEVSVTVAKDKVLPVCQFLAKECQYDMLTDVSGIDNYGEDPRFGVVYHVYSMTHRVMLRVKAGLCEDDMTVDSVVSVWKTADWHEREAFDMFGIRFRNHPNLKRILMWEGYPHYPLRKDFPLAGLPADLPETAVAADEVRTAPMLGGPFVPTTGTRSSVKREPRQVDVVAEHIERLNHPKS
jgi:NADH-quinone oxidoreductase subunit C